MESDSTIPTTPTASSPESAPSAHSSLAKWHHCGRKQAYPTAERAEAVLAQITEEGRRGPYRLEVYRCRYGDHYHLGGYRGRLDCRFAQLPRYVDHPHVWAAMRVAFTATGQTCACYHCQHCDGWHLSPVTGQAARNAAARMRRAIRRYGPETGDAALPPLSRSYP